MCASRSILIALSAACALLLFAQTANADEYVADRTDDPSGFGMCTAAANDCSLRQAINWANLLPGNSVSVPAGTYVLSAGAAGEDLNVGGDLDVLTTMTIAGAGPGATKIQPAGRFDRVFDFRIGSGDSVALSGLTVTGGGGVSNGAGIEQINGSLSIRNSVISDNLIASASSGGGGIYFVTGTLNLTNSSVNNNAVAGGQGGGIYTGAPAPLNITDSTISANRQTGAADGGGGIYNQDTVTIVNSTISANTAEGSGGGIDNRGGVIRNSTIAGNTAGGFGGGFNVSIGASFQIENSIVAGNGAPSGGVNCYRHPTATIDSKGHNIENGSSCPFTAAGDQPGTDPLLNPLADNGGPTPTMALQRKSPAIRAANAAACPATDQRGVARAGGCDIGAFQFDDITAPDLSKLKLKPVSFAPAKSGDSVAGAARARKGTRVSFELTETASVEFKIERIIKGHKKGSRCSVKRKRGKRCRIVKILNGSFLVQGKQGANSFKFTGRLRGKKLTRGSYRLVATPTDASTNTGATTKAKFRIAR